MHGIVLSSHSLERDDFLRDKFKRMARAVPSSWRVALAILTWSLAIAGAVGSWRDLPIGVLESKTTAHYVVSYDGCMKTEHLTIVYEDGGLGTVSVEVPCLPMDEEAPVHARYLDAPR